LKKVRFLFLLSFVLAVTNVKANIVVGPITSVNIQLTNLNEFPDVVIVAHDYGMINIPPGGKFSIVKGNRLPMSHTSGKPNTYYLLKKEYLEKIGIDKVDWFDGRNVQKLNLETGMGSFIFVEDYSAIEVEFKLVKKGNEYYVYKSKVTAKPRAKGNQQAAPDVVKTYTDNVVDVAEPIYISEKILSSI